MVGVLVWLRNKSELGTSCRNCCNLMMREIEKLVWILTLRENKFEKEK